MNMSDSEKPAPPSDETKPAETPTAQSPASPPDAPDTPSPRERTGQQYRAVWKARSTPQEPAKAEPLPQPPAPVPNLRTEEAYGPGPRLRDLDKEIEQELQEAMGGFDAKELVGEPEGRRKTAPDAEPGLKKARVVAIHGPDVFLDVPGGRSQGVLSLLQFPEGPPTVGAEVDVQIEGYDSPNGLVILSRKGAAQQVDWSSVAVGMIVEARVTATNKGGLSVEVNGIRGFMPISQIDLYRVENAEQFVNQRLRCLVVEVKPDERNLVVSRRALLEQEREEMREKVWQELAEGQIREGIVRSVRDFGAFVDLGGADGLLHVSEMSWTRVQNPADVVQPGQTVKVIVLRVDREKRKVSLGLKQLQQSPWDTVEANYPTGSTVKGKVTKLMEFGAFVELEPGLEGLVHISELATHRVRRANEVVQPGQEVQVKVLNIDRNQRRISLSLKAATAETEEPTEEAEEEATPKPARPRTTPLRGGIGNE
jgi:small subunit ribosomal protein S1